MSEWQTFRDEALAQDPELRRGYDRLGPLYEIVSQAISYRLEQGLTQEQLAQKMGKQQPAIARFEGARVWPSLSFLQELADALDAELVVRLESKKPIAKSSARVAEGKGPYST